MLWLWCRLVATGLIRPLVWEPPYAVGVALKRFKKKKKKKKRRRRKKERKRKKKKEGNKKEKRNPSNIITQRKPL